MRSMSRKSKITSEMAERLGVVRGKIQAAAARAGRDPSEVALIAVTKTHPPEAVQELFDLGQNVVGENRVQEFVPKYEALGGQGEWHFIGHLQRNKAAQIVGRAALIHSVDSVRLLRELEKRSAQKEVTQRILIELNLSGEPNKTGADPKSLPEILEALAGCEHLRGEGLMTMAPNVDDPEAARPYFRRLKDTLASLPTSPNFEPRHLSMGMSGDFEVAIEEGSTLVRVGTGVMGPRRPRQE